MKVCLSWGGKERGREMDREREREEGGGEKSDFGSIVYLFTCILFLYERVFHNA